MTTKYAIWDIDNCLADDYWRQPLIEWHKDGNARYDGYNAQMAHDAVVHKEHFEFMSRFTTPVFFTGRCVKWEQETRTWLRKLGGHSPVLFMRGNDEDGSPALVKQRMLRAFRVQRNLPVSDIVAAFDDVPAVVAMYQASGIAACRLAIYDDLSGVYRGNDLQPVS